MDETFLPTRAAARYLGISAKTLLRAVRRGTLTAAHRTPGGHLRFRCADLDAYLCAWPTGPARQDSVAPLVAVRGDERFRALFTATPLPTYAWRQAGADWTLVAYNDAAVAITDGAIAALVGRSARALYADRPEMLDDIARAAREGAPLHREMPWRFASTGREAILAVTYVPVPPDLVLVQTEDITPRERARVALAAANARAVAILESMADVFVAIDRSWRITYVNAAAERSARRPRDELLARPLRETFVADAVDIARLQQVMDGHGPLQYEAYHRPLGQWLEVSCYPVAEGLSIYMRDVTARVRAARMRAVTDAGLAAMLYAVNEDDLMRRVCAALVDVCGYRLAWVGYAEDDPGRSVRPVAWAGPDAAYLDAITISWADGPTGRGPTGTAIRMGVPQVLRDMHTASDYAPWQVAARAHGFASGVALPLTVAGRTIGALNVYASEPDAFDADEQGLLRGLADDLSYGLAARRADAERSAAEDALRSSEERYRTIVETAQEGIWQIDAAGCTTFVNDKMAGLLGYTPAAMHGTAYLDYVDAENRVAAETRIVQRRATGTEPDRYEVRLRRKDGSALWGLVAVTVLTDEAGSYAGAVAMITDITARKHAEDALRASEERFRALSERASDLVTLLDRDGTISYASPSHLPLLGYTPADLEGTDAFARIHPDDAARIRDLFTRNMREGGTSARYEMRYRHADGSWRTLEAAGVNRLDDPAVRGFIVNSRDITERKQAEEALAHQALHDDLTGLPNRTLLSDRLERARLAAHRGQAPIALLLLDLDRFKEVNDTFGHHHGDLLLREVARRLAGLVRETDTVARLGGDEFAVVLPEGDAAGAVRVAHQIIDALDTPFGLDGHTIHIGVSVGIAIYPTHGADAATLVRRADVAMYLAKRTQGGYAVYDASQDQHSPQRIALVTALRRAIPEDGLTLHYQPQLALVDGPPGVHDQPARGSRRRLVGAEALVRWRHPERGLIPPDEFIPLAEGTGLIKGLTERVLAMALSQCCAWRRAGLLVPVAVNLSAWNLRDPGLVQTVAELLQAQGIPPAWLRLEMTEGAIMADTERAVAVLSQLVALGIRVSVDDYGTGYSSLAYLKRLPVDELKIDKSFVRDMARDETDAAIVRSTVSLAHTLGLRAVAEGVEDEATWAQLVTMGCDAAQGYFISRPVTADALERWLRATGEMAADTAADNRTS